MKKFSWVIFYVFCGFVGLLVASLIIEKGYSDAAYWLLIAPFMGSLLVSGFTVFTHGKLEHQREAAAAFISYGVLALFTAVASLINEPEVLDKFVDAFLFGQVVSLLSIIKTCLQAWADPVPQEDRSQRVARHAASAQIRTGNRALAREGRQ